MKKLGFGLLTISAMIVTAGHSDAGHTVHEAAPSCARAHAILMASTSGNHSLHWEAIGRVAKSSIHAWQIVDEPEPMVAQKIAFKQWDTKFHDGGTAYVAHCGAGVTCNDFAKEILKLYPNVGDIGVYCGEVPHILDNPTNASF